MENTRNLKIIENLVDSEGDRRLLINADFIYYDNKLEVFVRRANDIDIFVSKHITAYSFLENYKDCYLMLLDLGIDYKVLNEIFIVDGTETVDSLHELRLFMKRTQESLRRPKADFCSVEDIAFLEVLRRYPKAEAVRSSIANFEKAQKQLSEIGKLYFMVTDDDTKCFFKNTEYSNHGATITVNLLTDAPVTKMDAFD